MKNKKVKWSVISVTSLAFLSFAGLVTGNYNGENTTTANNNSVDSNNNSDRFAQDHHGFGGQSSDSDTGWNDGSNAQSEWGQSGSDSDSDSDSSENQDRFFQAPSGGFDQGEGHGSSGSSK